MTIFFDEPNSSKSIPLRLRRTLVRQQRYSALFFRAQQSFRLWLTVSMLSSVFLLIGCDKENTGTGNTKPVVEAYLQPGQTVSVTITREIPYGTDGTGNYALTDLQVMITNNGNTYTLNHVGDGIYQNAVIPVIAGDTYSLSFDYSNQAVTASTTVPDKPYGFTSSATSITIPSFGNGSPGTIPTFPDPIDLNWRNPNGDYHFVVVKSAEIDPDEITTSSNLRPNFTTSPAQGSSQEINFGEFKYYGRNAIILCKVLPDYVALYNSNGSSSQNLTAVPSNINNGLGIFTSINTADTLYITVD